MAKITGPLMSIDARGKFGKALVFMGWKGIQTVRMLVTPANPQTAPQGNIRTILGGLGRGIGVAVASGAYILKLKALDIIPQQQTHQSYLVQYIKDTYIGGSGATLTGNYSSIVAEFTGITMYTSFQAAGADLGVADFGLSYDSIADFDKGLALYLLAKTAIVFGFTGAPYTVALTTWTSTQIDQLVSHLQA